MEVISEIVMKKLNEIKPYIRNPRKNDKTVQLLVDLIPKVGFNVPILIDENGVIVKGHARFNAAIKLGMDAVPCVVTHADEETIKLDRLADNKVSEFSEWVNDELLHEIDMLNVDFDLEGLGFSIAYDDEDVPGYPEFEDDGEPVGSATPEEEEARKQRYLEYLKELEAKAKPEVITSQKEIDSAKGKQESVGEVKTRYYKVICPECGHIVFIKEGDIQFED